MKTKAFKLIHLYYEDAPAIVQAINMRDDKNQLYEKIFANILKIVSLIDSNHCEEAVIKYCLMT